MTSYNTDLVNGVMNVLDRNGLFDLDIPEIIKLVEEKLTSNDNIRDAIAPLVIRAVTTDGSHHKQWYLEAIAEALQIELPPHEAGI
jgi:hypothetical protein